MTEDLHREEEVEKTTPQPESESGNASEDLESLFADDSQEDSQEDPQAKIKSLEDKIARIEKGVSKFFSEKGREAKQQPKDAKGELKGGSSVLKSLYFNANPEAKEVWDMVEEEAKKLAKDPFDLYESSAYLKGEAKARAEAKKVEEENKSKIIKPTSGTGSKPIDVSSVKPEDVAKLTPAQKIEWIKKQAERERASDV